MLKKIVLTVALTALTLASQSSHAHTFTTFGKQDCGQWQKSPAKLWLTGYLSGLSHALSGPGFDPLGELNSMDQADAWMDKYCRENPLSDIAIGGVELIHELAKKVSANKKANKK